MERPARMTGDPFEDVRLFVSGIVVDDGVDDFSGRHGALDGLEEANELLVAMPSHAASDHGSVEDVERGEQRGRTYCRLQREDPDVGGPGLPRTIGAGVSTSKVDSTRRMSPNKLEANLRGTPMALSVEDVHNAYLFILGRPPESERVVQRHQQAHANVLELRAAFLASKEFVARTPAHPRPCVVFEPPQDIETVADAGTLMRIVEKTGTYWSAIGETAPHWSVITHDRYRPENLSANEAAFYQSGAGDRNLVVALLRRIGRDPLEFRCCVEFGCGVGRVTIPLSKNFAKVIAVDISPSHLAAAADYAKSAGLSNIHFVQATTENLMPATGYDLWFSRLVLQHNAPPVNLAILDKAFAGLPPRGVAIVHIPTWHNGYRFKIGDYLAGPLGQGMEMHATPQREILDLAFRHGCGLRNIHEEPGHAVWITNIFVFQKGSSSPRSRVRGGSPSGARVSGDVFEFT